MPWLLGWRPVLRLEVLTGLGVVVVMVAPWYLAVATMTFFATGVAVAHLLAWF